MQKSLRNLLIGVWCTLLGLILVLTPTIPNDSIQNPGLNGIRLPFGWQFTEAEADTQCLFMYNHRTNGYPFTYLNSKGSCSGNEVNYWASIFNFAAGVIIGLIIYIIVLKFVQRYWLRKKTLN